jgi:hypothetical protein
MPHILIHTHGAIALTGFSILGEVIDLLVAPQHATALKASLVSGINAPGTPGVITKEQVDGHVY